MNGVTGAIGDLAKGESWPFVKPIVYKKKITVVGVMDGLSWTPTSTNYLLSVLGQVFG